MPSDIRITAEPVDAQRCKFLVDRPVYQGVRRFAGRAEAAGSPLAEALFALPGVRELIVSGNLVTVVKESPEAWQVDPMVARHGGRVELIDVQESIVLLRMSGGCQGCGMASVTLRQGIEGILNQHLPEVKGIVDITDHTSGSNPYFASAKK